MTTDERDRKIFRIYIKAPAPQVWEAIVDPAKNGSYGYRVASQYGELQPGGRLRVVAPEEMAAQGAPELMIDGEILEVDAPRRLVQTYRMYFTPEMGEEPYTTLTYDIVDEGQGYTRLTVIHDVTGAPLHAATVFADTPLFEGGGGWAWIISDLKTLLEVTEAG